MIKKRTSREIMFFRFLLMALIGSLFVTSIISPIAFERSLLFSGLWLIPSFGVLILRDQSRILNRIAKHYDKGVFFSLFLLLMFLSIVSNIVPRVYSEILSPFGTATKEDEIATSIYFARFIQRESILSTKLFTDLGNFQLLRYTMILNNVCNTLKTYNFHHDRSATLLQVEKYIKRSDIIIVGERTEGRFVNFFGKSIFEYITMHEQNIIYTSGKMRICLSET